MRASRPGGPEVMALVELPRTAPGPGQALVRVAAAGVNFIDIYHRSGAYPAAPPILLGLEGAGTIEALGADTVALAVGDRVAWTGVAGSYASHVLAPTDRLVPLPAGIASRTAAAAMLQGLTAHYLTTSTFPLAPGHSCLVHAAAGGVGLLLCQLAQRAGARVIGTVSTAAKAERARAAGASDIVLYRDEDVQRRVADLTGGRGVDVVYDSVGRDTFDASLACLRPRGMLVLFGQSSGAVPPFDPQRLSQGGSLFLTRPSLFHHIADRGELIARSQQLLGWIAAGALRVSIDRALPLARAGEAHQLLASRATIGKLLLVPEGA
jgi:NADPH2:quinone reductase